MVLLPWDLVLSFPCATLKLLGQELLRDILQDASDQLGGSARTLLSSAKGLWLTCDGQVPPIGQSISQPDQSKLAKCKHGEGQNVGRAPASARHASGSSGKRPCPAADPGRH